LLWYERWKFSNSGITIIQVIVLIVQSDIIGVAMDLDNHKLYFGKNGAWQNSATYKWCNRNRWNCYNQFKLWILQYGRAWYNASIANFGNGYFGTTAVASAGTNASGIGIFEYDVPTGYTALSTKGLNL
jgi:hypothetical protein